MRRFFVVAALAIVVARAGVGAQTVTLTESEMLAQIGDRSPYVQAARSAVDAARADVLAAGRWPNPRVTFNREAVAGVAEDIVTVSQALPLTGRRGLDVSAANARVEASALRADDRIRRVRADARLAYTQLWAAQERERELAGSRERLTGLAGMLGKREAAGDAAGFDRLRAEREVIQADAARADAAADRRRAQAILAGFLTSPGQVSAIEAAPPASRVAVPSVEELVARAETRGDLVALASEIEAAAFAEQAARRRAIPEPELVAGTKTSNAAGGDVGSIVSVHVTVPVFDRGRPERAAAQARGRQARAEADALRQTIRSHIAAWHAALVERRDIADRHRLALGAGSDQIERIALVSYEAGERGILDLLDAYRTTSAMRVRQIELDAAVRAAEIELAFLSNWEMP